MTFVDWAAVILLGLPVIDWTAVWVIQRALRHYPRVKALRDRRRVAVAIAATTTVFAFLGLSRLQHIELPGSVAVALILGAVCGLSAVNLAFLWQYRRALWGKPKEVPVAQLHEPDEPEDTTGGE